LKSRSEVDISREFTFKHSHKTWTGVPVMIANMDTTGTFKMAEAASASQLVTCMHKHYTVDEWVTWSLSESAVRALPHVAVSAGTSDSDKKMVAAIVEKVDVPFICLDVANGYSEAFVDTVRKYRESFDRHTILAGNVVTGEMAEELILTGADLVKVGIGPGSVCTTRRQTGVGYPQLSAIIETADAAHGLKGHIVADGGCTCPGDFAKAFGGGADFVMAGGTFAGHDESSGELVKQGDKWFKSFYGMSSAVAMKRHSGGVAEYRSSEGKAVMVPYKGSVSATISDLLGGLRSTCTYVGAGKLRELPRRTTFIRVTQQLNEVYGKAESPPVAPEMALLEQKPAVPNGVTDEPPSKRPRA